jgi:hypothetical protein
MVSPAAEAGVVDVEPEIRLATNAADKRRAVIGRRSMRQPLNVSGKALCAT